MQIATLCRVQLIWTDCVCANQRQCNQILLVFLTSINSILYLCVCANKMPFVLPFAQKTKNCNKKQDQMVFERREIYSNRFGCWQKLNRTFFALGQSLPKCYTNRFMNLIVGSWRRISAAEKVIHSILYFDWGNPKGENEIYFNCECNPYTTYTLHLHCFLSVEAEPNFIVALVPKILRTHLHVICLWMK